MSNLLNLFPDELAKKYAEDVVKDPAYQTATPEEVNQARADWFDKFVAPNVPKEALESAHTAFDYSTAGDLKQVYKDPEFLKASTETQKALLRKNLIARGDNPDEVSPDSNRAGVGVGLATGMKVDKVQNEYAKFLSDPEIQHLINRGVVGQIAKPVQGINQTVEYLNPFTSHEERAKRLQNIQNYSDETKKIEGYFPDQKAIGMAAEAAPYVATGGIAAGVKGVTGVATRAGVAAATGAATDVADGTDIGNQKATTGAIAGALQGLFEGIPAVYSNLIKYKNSNVAERAIQSAAEELAKINNPTVTDPAELRKLAQVEVEKSAANIAANKGDLTATADELADRASAKLLSKADLTEKQSARLQEALQKKLGINIGSGSSHSVAQSLQNEFEAGQAARNAEKQAKIDEINAQSLGASKGDASAPTTLSQRFVKAVQDWKDALKPAYRAEVAPAENAVVGTYDDIKNALDNATIAGSPKAIKDTPSLNGRTTAYQNIAKNSNAEAAVEDAINPEYAAIAAKDPALAEVLVKQGALQKTAAASPASEATPMSLADLNRHIDELEAQLAPAFQKDNPGVANVDVLQAQKRTLENIRKDFLANNPDIAAKLGKADAAHAAGKAQFFESGTDVAGNKVQNSVMKKLYDKVEAQSLTEKDLDTIFTSGNPVQNIADVKRALGDTPETDQLLADSFYNWAKDKLPSGGVDQKVKTLEKLLGKDGDTAFADLARSIKTGDNTTAFDDLTGLYQLHKNSATEAETLANSMEKAKTAGNKYLDMFGKTHDVSKITSKVIEDPHGVGAEALRSFGHPVYGEALELGAIKDVATDMRGLSPKELYNKYGTPFKNNKGSFGSINGSEYLANLTAKRPEEAKAFQEILDIARRDIETGSISKFKYGISRTPEEVKAAAYEAGKNLTSTSALTNLMAAIDKHLFYKQQQVLSKYLASPEYAREVTQKVMLGMSKEQAVNSAFRNHIKSIAAGAAVNPAKEVLIENSPTARSILDTPHEPLKINITPQALPEVQLPTANVTLETQQ